MRSKITLSLCVLAVAACAEAVPPPELVAARAAYKEAESGPAAQLDPAALHVAEVQLSLAEDSFDKTGNSVATRADAYDAERKAQLATSLARTMEANSQINLATQKLQLTQATVLQNTRTELAQSREQLAAATLAMAELANMKSVNVKQEPRGTVITLSGSVLFASGKDELLPSAQATLSNVGAAVAKSDPSSKILIQGYTDSQGSRELNESLSEHRAMSVRDFLAAHGIPAARMTALGFGPANPVASNHSPEGRANNRRVEIVIGPPAAAPPEPVPTTRTTTTTVVH